MDNTIDLKTQYKVATQISSEKFGEFVRQVKDKYGTRKPPLMISTIENLNNTGKVASVGGPRENDIWFVYIEKDQKLWYKSNIIVT